MPANEKVVKFVLDERLMTIEIYREHELLYEIDLERCVDAEQLLDWLFQIHAQSWCTHQLIGELMDFLDCLTGGLQGAFCQRGASKKVVWKDIFLIYHKKHNP